MRKFTLSVLALMLAMPLLSQNKKNSRVASPEQLQMKAGVEYRQKQLDKDLAVDIPAAKTIVPSPGQNTVNPNGVQAVSPVTLGRTSNAFTILRGEQNQVFVNQDLNTVGFIHRQDITIHGGGGTDNGRYRYDLSIDGGQTFTTDIGPLQTTYQNYGRYPNMTGYNPAGNSNPFDASFVWSGPTNKFPTPGWIGHVYGLSSVTQATPTSSEAYLFDTDQTLLPGGLCEGLPGEFWQAEFQWDGSNILDSIYVYKGSWNATSQDVDWVRHAAVYVPYDLNFDGVPHAVGPNIAFSPDGNTGWIGILSDLTGGAQNESYMPVFIKSTDGGATWGSAVEFDLSTVAWIDDSLQTLWVDSIGDPASSGIPTCAFDYDLTVDKDGNPHLGVIVGTAANGYSISSGITMFLIDAFSPDGGNTWDATYLAPNNTLRGEFGAPDANGDLLTMDNFVQVARDAAGERIFFSFTTTDTVGQFGETTNLAPDLVIAAKRITDGYQSCFKKITWQDLTWGGQMLFPTMAPSVLKVGDTYKLPIVSIKLLANDQGQPCEFYYFGNDALIFETDFMDPNSLDLTWDGACGAVVSTPEPGNTPDNMTLVGAYPNPTRGMVNIHFELNQSANVNLQLTNIHGQTVMDLNPGQLPAGEHKLEFNTQDLSSGVYFYTLSNGQVRLTKKLIVE